LSDSCRPADGLLARLRRRERLIGLWCSLSSTIALDVVTDSGFDWLLIDTEHAPNDVPQVLAQLQVAERGVGTAIVRPAANDAILIKRLLDIGASTLLIPMVETPEDAQRAVAASRYPPNGTRGVTASGRASRYGRDAGYLAQAHDRTGVIVQVESRLGLQNLDMIACEPGVDGVFVGPSDLAASLGCLGRPRCPEVLSAVTDAGARLQALGVPAGVLTTDPEEAHLFIESGYTFVAVGSDIGLLARGADSLARRFASTS
jgi:4-hydroxy-2-oxoheptanedioate aldolase